MQCDKCGSDNTTLKKEGYGKRGKWQLFSCQSGCIQEDGQWAGKPYTFFGNTPTPKQEKKSYAPSGSNLKDEFEALHRKLDKIMVLLTDPLERVSREAQSSFGGQQVATQEEETPF